MRALRPFAAGLLAAGLLTACKKSAPTAGGPAPGAGPGAAAMTMTVVAVEARKQPVVESVSLVGNLAANEAVEVKAETDGIVEELLFEEGQEIEKGALLVRLDETKFLAELADAEARLKLSQASYTRARQLLQERLISEQEFDQAASTFAVSQATVELRQRQLRDAKVPAPFTGRTGARAISPGQVITRNTTITWLVDLDPMKVEVDIPERFLGQTRIGQKVQFQVTAYPERKFEGEIYFIASRLDEGTRTAQVKTRIANPDGALKSGMVANLELKLVIREQAVVVPEAALMSNGDMTFVYLVGPEQVVQLRPVTVGQRLPRWVEVTAGLQGGELVVAEGHQKIGPGMKVTLAPPEKAAVYQNDDLNPAPPRAGPATNAPAAAPPKPA
jgi:membrane fusion protein (multidrug efflux system)